MVNFTSIPADLKQNCRFIVWKKEKGKDGRMTKIPYTPETGRRAQSNFPETFSEFKEAAMAYAMGGYEGIGIRVSDGIGAFDIDHCVLEDGSLNEVATGVLKEFNTCYVEKSPSGTGLRGFFKVPEDFSYDKVQYYINNQKVGLEIYIPGATHRFVTVTGDVFREGGITEDAGALQTVLDTYMKRKSKEPETHIEPHSYLTDEEVLERIGKSVQAEKFNALYKGEWQDLYGSQSDADMALLSILAFWCGCDADQMDRMFRASGLMRDKWDRKQSGSTYGALTIDKVVRHCAAIFDPVHRMVPPEDEFESILDQMDEEELSLTTKQQLAVSLSLLEKPIADFQPNTNPLYSWSEMGLGRLFADYYKRIARFVPERKKWFVFNGKVWVMDTGGMMIMQLAKHLVNELIRFSASIERDADRTAYLEFVTKIQSRRKRQIMVDDAQDEYFMKMMEFDRHKLLFNCNNGTLDFNTMEFRKHSPEDFLTMMSPVDYDPNADCPRWHSFVKEVMCGDEELADFLQRALGYTLTGDTSLECLFILYGATSRNGKGTTMETFLKIMGEYGKTSNPEMLGAKFGSSANSGGPSEEIARLVGARFVNISEPEKKITFNAALVKRLTGNDTINARLLNENSFDFKPVFKIFINTNYLPNITDMTVFESGRIKIIPFQRHFSEAEQDKSLKALFSQSENLSGILNWCVEGYRKFKERGLAVPEAVNSATTAYRKESDRMGQFVEAWLEEGETYEVRTSAVYRVYNSWCAENGFNAENAKNFNAALSSRFTIKRKRPKAGGSVTTMLVGVRLKEDEEAMIPES